MLDGRKSIEVKRFREQLLKFKFELCTSYLFTEIDFLRKVLSVMFEILLSLRQTQREPHDSVHFPPLRSNCGSMI